jgi:hypothetical protein
MGVEPPVEVIYRGAVYRRYPSAPQRAHRVYYVRTDGGGYLHRQVFVDHHGPIPAGCQVHHRDGDPFNNSPENLEAVLPAEHRATHGGTWDDPEAMAAHLGRIQHLAAEWHRSEEGRAWHREHGRRTWDGRKYRTLVCRECGEEFRTRYAGSNVELCSKRCRNRWRDRNPAYQVERSCEECGAGYLGTKYRATRFCSVPCRNRAMARGRRTGVRPDGGG